MLGIPTLLQKVALFTYLIQRALSDTTLSLFQAGAFYGTLRTTANHGYPTFPSRAVFFFYFFLKQ